MIVACATDRSFVQPTCVMLASLVKQGGLAGAPVKVFGFKLKPQDEILLKASYSPFSDRLEVIDLSKVMDSVKKYRVSLEVPSVAAFARLFIPDFLVDAERLLYLDGDIIVNGDLNFLASLDFQEHVAAAVADAPADRQACLFRSEVLGLSDPKHYFNSGVLLIDCSRWRQERITRKAVMSVERKINTALGDQDHINYALQKRWLQLDRRWNFFSYPAEALEYADYAAATIVHFASAQKPWFASVEHPYKDVFLTHRMNTDFRDSPLISANRRRFQRVRRTPIKAIYAYIKRKTTAR